MTARDDVETEACAEPDRSAVIALSLGSKEWRDRLAAARAARAEALAAKGPNARAAPSPTAADDRLPSTASQSASAPSPRANRRRRPGGKAALATAFGIGIAAGVAAVSWLGPGDAPRRPAVPNEATTQARPAAPEPEMARDAKAQSIGPTLASPSPAPAATLVDAADAPSPIPRRPNRARPPTTAPPARGAEPAAPARTVASLAAKQNAPAAIAAEGAHATPTVAGAHAPLSPDGLRAALRASAETKLSAPKDARTPRIASASTTGPRVVQAARQAAFDASQAAAIRRLSERRWPAAAIRLLVHRPEAASTPDPRLALAGLPLDLRPSFGFAPAEPLVQYFAREDADLAADIAAAIQGRAMDLTRFRPQPPDRRIEIYLPD